ncbi:MAG: PTS ascorbate transporter subunit IIC [Solobacterium sp.]|nr:PTS ascorbate transporter subunit IIC [Solobacterium sp.]
MEFLKSIWMFFQSNILTQPAFFVGFLVLIGYLLLKKPLYQAYAGFVKATVGYLILNVGSGGLVSTFRPILAGLNQRFNLNAAVIDPYFGQAAAQKAMEAVGRTSSLLFLGLLVAFFVNILLVALRKVTKVRTLFITGHIMMQQSATGMWMIIFLFPQFQDATAVILMGIIMGIFWAVSSNLTVEVTQRLTDGGGFAVGHQQMFGIWLVDKLAPIVGGKDAKPIEELELPGWLSIFTDNVVATGTLMLLFFGVLLTVLGPDFLKAPADQGGLGISFNSFVFYVMQTAFQMAVYLSILQLGVRMFVAELTESFTGISEKLLPGSVPAVDCAATYGFGSPNAPIIGFFFGALGQFLAILGLVVFKSPILIITGFVPVFFDNATFAVFANKASGLKAASILTFLSGIVQVLGGALCASIFQTYEYGGWHGNFDVSTVWLVGGLLQKYLGIIGYVLCIVALLAIPQLQYRKDPEHYFEVVEDWDSYKAAKSLEA